MADQRISAVLVCAGSGTRMKEQCGDKLRLELEGIPVVVHTLLAYEKASSIDRIIVVTKAELIDLYYSFKETYNLKKVQMVVEGGKTRMESVLNGVRATTSDDAFVAIGDGARPLIRTEDIDRTVHAAQKCGAAALGCYLTDTIKKIDSEKIIETVPRNNLVGIQTPQVFEREEYLRLAEKALLTGIEFTDDASVFEHFGKEVAFVEGHRDNLKITVPEDIPVMKAILEARK